MKLTQDEFGLLRNFVREKAGIYFADSKMYLLESRLKNRLKELGIGTGEGYYMYVRSGEKAGDELLNLFDVVTTNETSFFRNPPQLEAFKTILREICEEKGRGGTPLRIWSAGCSTGEEPYTLAIILLEMIESIRKDVPFVIYGTDISPNALDAARRALFNAYTMRNVSAYIKEKYFVRQNDLFTVKEAVKKYVKLEFMNLNDSECYRKYSQMDVIFCRNVLIYFDEEIKGRVVSHLRGSLRPGGYLMLGHSESLNPVSKAFRPILLPRAVMYRRAEA